MKLPSANHSEPGTGAECVNGTGSGRGSLGFIVTAHLKDAVLGLAKPRCSPPPHVLTLREVPDRGLQKSLHGVGRSHTVPQDQGGTWPQGFDKEHVFRLPSQTYLPRVRNVCLRSGGCSAVTSTATLCF